MRLFTRVGNSLKPYLKGAEWVYAFAAVDDHYGLFYCCFASKKPVTHGEIEGYVEEIKKLIDMKGSPGLDEWYTAMKRRGFRPMPSRIAVLSDRLTVLDCLPSVDHPR